jgi:phage replication-related protein YjqB (UPF0714/DUF867 family)
MTVKKPPRNYAEIIGAGYRRGRDKDFRVVTKNRAQLRNCLLVAPHGGCIEPMTSKIVCAVASVSNRAYYLFEGQLPKNNWNALHIDSRTFDEPEFEKLVAKTDLVVSFHGKKRDQSRTIYVGGLHQQGRGLMIQALNKALGRFKLSAVDATVGNSNKSIAGLEPDNLTNRGQFGGGIQLEFTRAARLVFFPSKGRVQRTKPKENLRLLAETIDGVLDVVGRVAERKFLFLGEVH